MPIKFKFEEDRNISEDGGFTNGQRAKHGQMVLKCYDIITDNKDESCLPDLLGDILHLCDRDGVDFNEALENAKRHWQQER